MKSTRQVLLEAHCFRSSSRMLDFMASVMRDKQHKHHSSLRIINEANLTGGENVGGATSSPAPEVAASDDDDSGGDDDGESDPPRRRKPRTTIPATAEHFDRLPDSALADLATLRALTGKSRATIYRWISAGILPPPRKLGLSRNVWTAGEIRRALSA